MSRLQSTTGLASILPNHKIIDINAVNHVIILFDTMRPWHTVLLELPVGKDAVQLVVVGFADTLEVWLGEAVAIVGLNPTEETSLPMRKPGHCSRQMSSPKQSLAQRSERSKSQRSSQQTRAK